VPLHLQCASAYLDCAFSLQASDAYVSGLGFGYLLDEEPTEATKPAPFTYVQTLASG
jgi:hypothetical protein